MTVISDQHAYELILTRFLDITKTKDTNGLIQLSISREDVESHKLDPKNAFRLIATSLLLPDRNIKLGVSISLEGWSFWFGAITFPIASGDFNKGDELSRVEKVAQLFLDLVYKRIGMALHVANIEGNEAYDLSGQLIKRAVKVAQFYLKTSSYELLATVFPYPNWQSRIDSNGTIFSEKILTNELIILDEAGNEVSNDSITLLKSIDFPFEITPALTMQVEKMSDIKPLKQTLSFEVKS